MGWRKWEKLNEGTGETEEDNTKYQNGMSKEEVR